MGSVATGQSGKIETELPSCGCKIEDAILRKRRSQRIRIPVIETESVAMDGVRNLISIGGLLSWIRAHA